MFFDIKDFTAKIICENNITDAIIETSLNNNELDLYITAHNDKPEFVELFWKTKTDKDMFVLGDAWERSYGDLEFKRVSELKKHIPWYFIATDKEKSFCFGVKTQPNAFISFRYNSEGITAIVDCRNGGCGVHLNGRKICLATFVLSEYDNTDIFECLKDYCKKLCDNPILPKERIYGGNNWYYAYGKSSYEEILADAKLQAELAQGTENKPFEVIDDCWQINSCAGPWIPNEKFGDMKKLAEEIKECGVRPGIWVRFLRNKDETITDAMRIHKDDKECYLDPTHPDVKAYIKEDIKRIKSWGYELIKHDFTTFDLFGSWGADLDSTITKINGWHFHDKTKTNAEIVLDLYKLIKDTAEDVLIIGCNTISHLCAGLVEINRTGNDTSGREWNATKENGVNTLAFRLAQNEAFYMCDADCVGILNDMIPWEKNSQWLHLLSYSNTPLFVSCNNSITDEQKNDIKTAYKVFHKPHTIKPLDIYDTKTPSEWEIDGEKITYNW